MKVLVVDDFARMRRIVKKLLKQIGFTKIVEADDGTTALAVIKKQEIGLILADWNMPKMSGLELLKAVRSDESIENTPFVMVTAEAQKSAVLEAVQAGVSNYIVKPLTGDVIKEMLTEIL
ncbi:MAG: response regulator [Desulfobacterales bacterium]|nr:response regulator [Desulfobacterales bacterium]